MIDLTELSPKATENEFAIIQSLETFLPIFPTGVPFRGVIMEVSR